MGVKGNKKLLYFIQLPPPVHGVSTINEIVFNSKFVNQGFTKKLIEIKFSEKMEELRKFSLLKFWVFIKTIFQLKYALLKFKPDLVYFSFMPVGIGFLRDAVFALIIKSFRRKIIFHLHNKGIPYYNKKLLYHFLYKIVFKNSIIIHLSNRLLDSEIKPLAIKGLRAFVVGNTIKPFKSSPQKSESKNLSLLFLSNYFTEKGLMLLLEAFKIIKDLYPQIRLNAYGASQSEVESITYQNFVKMNNLKDNVFIHGPVYGNEKKKVFEENDLFVFPSYFQEECFPLSILEAMNARLPIVATKIGAIPEMIEDGINGILINPQNPRMLQSAIETLIKNENLRTKLGVMAEKKFHREYAMEHFEKKIRAIMLDVSD